MVANNDSSWCPFIELLRDLEVLRGLDPDQLPQHEEGWLLLPCSDGHRFRDLWNFHLEKCGRGSCHHPLAELGGTLVLGHGSPLAKTRRGFHVDEVLIDKIEDSLSFKNLRNVAAYTHFPCSAADAFSLSPWQQLDLFASAVRRLHREFPHTHVVPFCHVHYPDNYHQNKEFRTYFVDLELYEELRSAGGLILSAPSALRQTCA